MDGIFGLESGTLGIGFGGARTNPGLSLIGLLQSGGPSPQGPLPLATSAQGVGSLSLQLLLIQSLLQSFQSLNAIWGGIAGGGQLGLGFGAGGGQLGFGGGLGYGGITLPPLYGGLGNGGATTLPPLPGGSSDQTVRSGGSPIGTNLDYKTLNTQQRNQLSAMTEDERAALHLWGIQMGSSGKQDGGVLLNVINHPEQFKPAEVALAKRLAAQDQAGYGGITGKSLDEAFFGLYQKITGKDISQRYASSPVHFATGEVNLANRQSGKNGLSQYENEVLQLWGHNPLFSGGKIDGSILEYALNSKNTLEANLDKSDLQTLLNADQTSDGVVNGDSLEKTFIATLDHVYNGGAAATQQRTMQDALAEANQRRAGLLAPIDPRAAANTQDVSVYARIFGSSDTSRCPFFNSGAQTGAKAAVSYA